MSYQPLNLYSLLFILQLNIFPSFLFYSKYFSSLLAHHLYVFHHSSCTRSHFLFIIIYFPLFLCLSISLFPIIFPCSSFFFVLGNFLLLLLRNVSLGIERICLFPFHYNLLSYFMKNISRTYCFPSFFKNGVNLFFFFDSKFNTNFYQILYLCTTM